MSGSFTRKIIKKDRNENSFMQNAKIQAYQPVEFIYLKSLKNLKKESQKESIGQFKNQIEKLEKIEKKLHFLLLELEEFVRN